jgi:peptidoglycan lytic transglycosylase
MSPRATSSRPPPTRGGSAGRSRRSGRRRRTGLIVATAAATALAVVALAPLLRQAVKEITLPLRHDDIIRQQARDKRLNPALIAAVIYAESRFRDGQTSSAGALGLMQLTPQTAHDIARKSGGIEFRVDDLATPQVNIAYGSFYLRYLLDRYGGNEAFALAAYNAGEGNVDRWIDAARRRGVGLTVEAIPFAETREYVKKVERYKHEYRRNYATELGLRRATFLDLQR